MGISRLLVANRGEVAVRVIRAAAELGIISVAVVSDDDAGALHARRADEAIGLGAVGVPAYLDGAGLVALAVDAGCDAVHPGWGFLSEQAGFAEQCEAAGITFVGPRPDTLAQFGDKAAARALAAQCGVPTLAGTSGPTTADEARQFLAALGPGGAIMLKALAGGGGRGIREVTSVDAVADAHARCQSEAGAAFGDPGVYVEQLLPRARHIEVQIVGDGSGTVIHLGERECSVQRRHQKLLELAPAIGLAPGVRVALTDAAVRLATEVRYRNLGTVEFLIDADSGAHFFVEANARLQVEHTVTEEVTDLDLVHMQLRLAGGATLAELGFARQADVPAPRGYAIQARVNTETMAADGTARPGGGTVSAFDPPTGPGVRTDSCGFVGYTPNPRFDSLLAKVIAHDSSADPAAAVARAKRALTELRIEGVPTNAAFLLNVVTHPDFVAGRTTTRFVDEHMGELVPVVAPTPAGAPAGRAQRAGATVNAADPLAVLTHGKGSAPTAAAVAVAPAPVSTVAGPPGTVGVPAPMQGTVVVLSVQEGDRVPAGASVLVMEAMKMEHVVTAPEGGIVRFVAVSPGDTVLEGHPLMFLEPADVTGDGATDAGETDPDAIRPDLAETLDRLDLATNDARRPEAVAKRHAIGHRTARENIEDLCDPGSFQEYGSLVIAAQRRRRPLDDLIARTQADGLVGGIGRVNGDLFDDEAARCAVLSYDYMVLAGTQGLQNHRKKDRLFELAERLRLPVVLFAEGGGGRPGDTDGSGVAGLDCMAFTLWGALSGLVPRVGIVAGRCFAGNAVLLGCCDVIIATADTSIGLGGPAMIEGGGLGVFHPDEVGPMSVQVPNGVVDIAVADEAEAVDAAKRYLSYFQGPVAEWECADQRLLRSIVPENRLRVYDIRSVIATMADTGSVLELRRHFGLGMVTSFIRVEGRPIGVIANNPLHLAGAIDSDGADKAARFMQLCDAFDIPLLFLCDTPGMMVGPEVERTALARHAGRMFVTGASITVPFFTIVVRKGYGLGAQAMGGGSFHSPLFTVSWPTGEFGGMGLEGAVKLGYRNELAAIEDPVERTALFDEMVARMYEHGKALSMASYFEIDDVIDPVDTRRRIVEGLRAAPPVPARTGKKRPCVDTW